MSASETSDDGGAAGEAVLVYATFPDRASAMAAASAALDDRLIACANILPDMTAVYRWNDAVETASEVVLICKTAADRAGPVVDALRSVHPYEVPAIVVVPITGGSAPFLRWIGGETRARATPSDRGES